MRPGLRSGAGAEAVECRRQRPLWAVVPTIYIAVLPELRRVTVGRVRLGWSVAQSRGLELERNLDARLLGRADLPCKANASHTLCIEVQLPAISRRSQYPVPPWPGPAS